MENRLLENFEDETQVFGLSRVRLGGGKPSLLIEKWEYSIHILVCTSSGTNDQKPGAGSSHPRRSWR